MMKINRNIIMSRVLLLTVSVGLFIGFRGIYANNVTGANSSKDTVLTAKQLKDISKSKAVTIADDSRASIIWTPKNQKNTLYKIASYLKQAKLYTGKIPKIHFIGTYNANIMPSKLNIAIDKRNQIIIQPAFYGDDKDNGLRINYIDNVLSMIRNNKKIYIESKDLFKWLKEDRWKTEFKMK